MTTLKKNLNKILLTLLLGSITIGVMLLEHFDLLMGVKLESKGGLEALNFSFAGGITTRIGHIKLTIISTKKEV